MDERVQCHTKNSDPVELEWMREYNVTQRTVTPVELEWMREYNVPQRTVTPVELECMDERVQCPTKNSDLCRA